MGIAIMGIATMGIATMASPPWVSSPPLHPHHGHPHHGYPHHDIPTLCIATMGIPSWCPVPRPRVLLVTFGHQISPMTAGDPCHAPLGTMHSIPARGALGPCIPSPGRHGHPALATPAVVGCGRHLSRESSLVLGALEPAMGEAPWAVPRASASTLCLTCTTSCTASVVPSGAVSGCSGTECGWRRGGGKDLGG